MSMFWMDAEMDDCEDGASGVLVLEPLVKGEMEEWLAPNPTFTASEIAPMREKEYFWTERRIHHH